MLKNITIRTRLIFVIALLGIELVVGAAIGLVNLRHANSEMRAMYADGMVCLGQLDRIVRKLDENQLFVAQALTADPDRQAKLLDKIDQNDAVIRAQWTAYRATNMEDVELQKAKRFD
jgi:methyl-accepting chemotaxis protein-1 (serine sensor receptor)